MIGAEALVPPTVNHMFPNSTATPVFGSATAETSPTVRRAQPGSVCHAGFGSNALQPLPAPLHADSVQPRALAAVVSDVPPTGGHQGRGGRVRDAEAAVARARGDRDAGMVEVDIARGHVARLVPAPAVADRVRPEAG